MDCKDYNLRQYTTYSRISQDIGYKKSFLCNATIQFMYRDVKKQKRWELAIDFEAHDWKNKPNIFEEEYVESREKFSDYFKKVEADLNVQEDWKLLDVGCNATCVSGMIKKGFHCGIDPLANELEIQKKVPAFEIKNATGENIPYPNENFDLVVCVNVIDHTIDPKEVMKEIDRVTKKDGYLVIAVYVYNDFICLMRKIAEKIPGLRNVGHPHTFSQKSFEKLVSSYYNILSTQIIYEGKDPLDFGKVENINNKLPFFQSLVSYINKHVLGYKWFTREYCLLCKKK
jgi:SAM-dependent methyltransferase